MALTATQRAMLATRAMAHVAANFTREQMADRTLNVYAELLRGEILPRAQDGPFHGSAQEGIKHTPRNLRVVGRT